MEMPAVTLQAIKQSPNFRGSHELHVHALNVHPPLHYKCPTHWDQPPRPSCPLPILNDPGRDQWGQLPYCKRTVTLELLIQVNLKKAHTAFQLAPVEPLQIELSDCQQGSHQLLNTPGPLGGPKIMHAGA